MLDLSTAIPVAGDIMVGENPIYICCRKRARDRGTQYQISTYRILLRHFKGLPLCKSVRILFHSTEFLHIAVVSPFLFSLPLLRRICLCVALPTSESASHLTTRLHYFVLPITNHFPPDFL